jgi:hypothetical protein
MANPTTVQLGDRSFPVVPQKHARLRHHLRGTDFQKLLSEDYSEAGYDLLRVLIPAVEEGYPEWEFDGFATEAEWNAYKEGDEEAYNEATDPSPTTDQIAQALETAISVNGVGRLGKLISLVQTAGTLQAQQGTTATQTQTSPERLGSNGG